MLYVACACGRAVPVPEGHAAPTVPCPDCGRALPVAGGPPGPAPARRVARSVRIGLGDWGCLAALVVLAVFVVTVPGAGRVLGGGLLACCVAPLLAAALVGSLMLRRLQRWQAEVEGRMRPSGDGPSQGPDGFPSPDQPK